MFLDKLFLQYQKGKKTTFGSRWMDWHGRFFLGSPADNGLGNTRDDLQHSAYFIAPDRIPPTNDPVAMKGWKKEGILYAQYRCTTEKGVSRGAFYVGLPIVLALVFLGGSLRAGIGGVNKAKEWWQTKDPIAQSSSGASESKEVAQCRALMDQVNKNQIPLTPSVDNEIDRCTQILK